MSETKIDIENVVKHLFEAYPNVNYIALNAAINSVNQSEWTDHWYFAGFVDQPVYKPFQGFPAWVAYDTIDDLSHEWAVFFLHISSLDHYYKDIPIQADPYDYASPRWFCWRKNEDGTMTQIVSEEIESTDRLSEIAGNIDELARKVYLDTALKLLKPNEPDRS